MCYEELLRGSPRPPKSPSRFAPPSPKRTPKKSVSVSLFGKDVSTISQFQTNSPMSGKTKRTDLPSSPYFSIDTHGIDNDFYINPLDWSCNDMIAYVTHGEPTLYDLSHRHRAVIDYHYHDATALKFAAGGEFLTIGTGDGTIRIFDMEEFEITEEFKLKDSRIHKIDQNMNTLICAYNGGYVSIIDLRSDEPGIIINTVNSAISVKISPDGRQFISTTEHPAAFIYDLRKLEKPSLKYSSVMSTVKAIDWSPFDSKIAAVGGGTDDPRIRIFDTTTGETLRKVWTGAQICNLFWNEQYNEIATTHGIHSRISIWRANNLSQVVTYSYTHGRALYASMSPDKSSIVIANPTDPLSFWKLFPKSHERTFQGISVR